MIAVDTSALMAIVLGEPEAAACRIAVAGASELLIAAPNLTEALVVAMGRDVHGEFAALIHDLALTVVPLTEGLAYAAFRAHRRWGKGVHPAKLNLLDCFAYALATERDLPLLFIGNDFASTDVAAAIG